MPVEPENRNSAVALREAPLRHAPNRPRIEGITRIETIPRPEGATRAESIRRALDERLSELTAERTEVLADLELSGGVDAGDDVADLGTKAFAREQEFALVCAIQGRITQVERAMQRLTEGRYGWCEGCAREIPVARLAAFPSVTQCVGCKQLEERR